MLPESFDMAVIDKAHSIHVDHSKIDKCFKNDKLYINSVHCIERQRGKRERTIKKEKKEKNEKRARKKDKE